ncbi:MAG: hypothetical protein HN576_14455 [Bacteriovoracaceae bacterium]|jgi:hypothetical protein|nr:hypothetical protein [Bacteriovoracaceae bacterium]
MKINYEKAKTQTEAFDLAINQITDEYIAKFNVKADVSYNKDEGTIKAKGKGFTLILNFDDNSVTIDLKLSFLLKPLRGKLMGTIENKIRRTV